MTRNRPTAHRQPEDPATVGEPGNHAPREDLPDNNPSLPPQADTPPPGGDGLERDRDGRSRQPGFSTE
jgi:hypothetical protein